MLEINTSGLLLLCSILQGALALRLSDSSDGLLRLKRQIVVDPGYKWFYGRRAEYVAPGGVHTETQVDTMKCLYKFMEYLDKMRLRPRNNHEAILNSHVLHNYKKSERVCFGYNKMVNCIKGAGKRGQRNGLKMMKEHPMFTAITGVDWLCEQPARRYRMLKKSEKCFKQADKTTKRNCDNKCKVNSRRTKSVADMARATETMERRVRSERAFNREQLSELKSVENLCK